MYRITNNRNLKTKTFIYLIVCIVLFSISLLHSQETWVKTYNPYHLEYVEGSGWVELEVMYDVEDILVAQDGGYVVSGSFDRWVDDEPPMWFDHWGFLMKTDSDGNLLWAKKDSVDFLGENDNYAFTETEESDFITVGYADGGGYMMKRNSEGNELWSIPYDDFGATSICKTNDGNIALGGVVESEIAIRKIDTEGNTIWTNTHNCGYTTIAYSIKQTSDDGFALTGLTSGDGYDVIVMKTDSNGDSLWTRTFDGFGGNDRGNCIIQTSDDCLLVCGWLYNSGYYGFIWKLNQFGDTLWSHYYDEGTLYYINSVVQSSDDGYVLQGSKLVKIDEGLNILWNEELVGITFGNGDRNLQELQNGGFVCVSSLYNSIAINKTDEYGIVSLSDENIIETNSFKLMNYPNPFNPATTIHFELPLNINNPIIEIFNIKGQKIKQFSDISNKSSVVWDGNNNYQNPVSSGIYFYRIKSNNFVSMPNKMILIK